MVKATKKPRATRSGTAQAAAEAMSQAAQGWPSCPAGVSSRIWESIMVARLPAQWAAVDLVHAEALARCLADLQENQLALEKEGHMIGRGKTLRRNPRGNVVEQLARRSLAQTRLLQLHAVPTARAADQAGSKAEAEAAAAVLKKTATPAASDIDALLASPRRLQ